MPRKRKLDKEEALPPTTPTEEPAKKPKGRSRKSDVTPPAEETAAVVSAISEPSPVPKPRSRRIGAKAPTPTEEANEPALATPLEPAAKEATTAKPARSRKPRDEAKKEPAKGRAKASVRTKAAPAAPADTEENDEPEIEISFRPISGRAKAVVREEPASDVKETGRQRSRKTRAPEPTPVDEEPTSSDDLPVPSWRPLAKAPASEPKAKPAEQRPARGGRTNSRRDQKTVAPEPEPEPAPEVAMPPTRPSIPIPPDAPQVVMLEGIPALVRDHVVYPPVMFFGNPSDERRATTVLDQIKMAAEAGVHLHAHLIELEVAAGAVDEAVAFSAFMLKKSVEADPQAQVLFRIVFQSPRGWQDKYPRAKYRDFYGNLAEPSVCDDEFWGVAKECLASLIRKLRQVDLANHILGVQLDRGEWFMGEDSGYDDSLAAQDQFRAWARMRYGNDQTTLKASWFDGVARFDSIQVPAYNPEGADGEKFIRSSRKQRRYVDYHLFLSDATVQRIGDLAYAAKEASEGYFLVGASYGYTFEWSHPSSGHLSLGKLLRTSEVDFVAGPPSYRTREPGGAAPFPCPIDSFSLNGKLYISEEDFKTSLAAGHEPDDFNPALRTPQALENVHWRGAGAALAHGAGVSWMDLWGNGWLKTPSVWARAAKVQRALIDRMEAPMADPDVAVFIDERSLAYLVEPHAFQLLVQNVRESVLRAGVSAGFYLISDLAHREKFPESKLYIFLNAWDIRPDLRAAIKSRLQRDNKVLFWLYSAGLFDAGRDSLERAREVTGIALKPQPFHSKSGTTILNKRHPISEAFPDRNIGGVQLEPSYFAIPEGATVLGEYTQTGLPSFVVKEFTEGPSDSHWTSVFLGEPQVNPALIRALAQMAGVHVWNFHDDVVHVRPPFLTIHCTGAGTRTIAMPQKFSAYNFITEEWSTDQHSVRLPATDGSTHTLYVGVKGEIEHLLNYDPKERLRIEELPPRDMNEMIDASNFDVPIMRLDEWMEGDDSDEVADEWFLRPPQIQEGREQATESPEKIGKRRRRRGSRDRQADGKTESFAAPDIQDFDINVMFRKKS